MATTTTRKYLQGEEARQMAQKMKQDKENQEKRDAEKGESADGSKDSKS